jgi:hypothetical protein
MAGERDSRVAAVGGLDCRKTAATTAKGSLRQSSLPCQGREKTLPHSETLSATAANPFPGPLWRHPNQ